MSAEAEQGEQTTPERAVEILAELVALIDAGTLTATPAQHAYLSGVLTGLALTPANGPGHP